MNNIVPDVELERPLVQHGHGSYIKIIFHHELKKNIPVSLIIERSDGTYVVGAADLIDPVGGEIKYIFQEGDLNIPGTYIFEGMQVQSGYRILTPTVRVPVFSSIYENLDSS